MTVSHVSVASARPAGPARPVASAQPPAVKSPAWQQSCKLKGGGTIPHGETITSYGKHYHCNDGKWEQIAYA
jgi:hypothetical protein